MLALTEQSVRYETVTPPRAVEVYVHDDDRAEDGWYSGELREWAYYEDYGWTGQVQFGLSVGSRYIGRFLAEHVREVEG
jgi:hypothetical protein